MSLESHIESEFVAAYKAKDDVRVMVLRLLKTAAKNRRVAVGRPLTDDDYLELLAREVKQRQESIDQFQAAGRQDLVDKEAAELAVLKGYLPEPLDADELAALVDGTVAALGAAGMKDMGRVMQAILKDNKGRVDGKALSDLVRARLAS